jgi:hypothetical protein
VNFPFFEESTMKLFTTPFEENTTRAPLANGEIAGFTRVRSASKGCGKQGFLSLALRANVFVSLACLLFATSPAIHAAEEAGQFYRLHEGITAYVPNPDGQQFTVSLDVRDLNLYANGPREILFKVYDPDGIPIVREIIPDDGCITSNLPDRIGGWDHELQAFINHFAKGTTPLIRWSAWSDPNRLKTLVARTFDRPIKAGKKGVYRIVLAGTPDHYVTLRLSPAMKYAVAGHPTFLHGHGDMFNKSYLYVPKGTVGLFLAVAEPDEPRGRRFKLTTPDGKVLFDEMATGGYFSPADVNWQRSTTGLGDNYEGQLLTLEVSDGPNDYLVKVTFQQSKKPPFAEYVGMGSSAVFAPDAATANAVQGGTLVVDGEVFWHPFQVRFHEWLKQNPLPDEPELRKELESVFNAFRLLETSDGRGSASWTNWAYAMGYYGCPIFRPGWVLMRRPDVPPEVKAIIKEGLIMGGDRLSFATHIEKVNGNAFSQINVALWYCHRATGDPLQKERFETFWERWTTERWGAGSGLSRSGDSQEHFAHDMNYGSYLLNNWKATGNTWVKPGGILGDATDDPRFQQVVDRYQELYSYLHCREASDVVVAANPWSSRTHSAAHLALDADGANKVKWKGLPGPDLTTDVNGGHEWFASRRKNYYVLTFHGRLTPDWMNECFEGQIGFGGGVLCQLTVPGKGPVLASTQHESYGKGSHPSQWPNLHIHSLVGERWDGFPVISGISEHDNARLSGNTVTSSGEIRGAHVKVSRSYVFQPDAIDCSVNLTKSDYSQVLSLWTHGRLWSEMRLAYEMIPFMPKTPDGKPTTVTTAEGTPLTTAVVTTSRVRIDRGGFGVEIVFEKPLPVQLGQNNTVLVQLVAPGSAPVPAEKIELKYKLAPFGE